MIDNADESLLTMDNATLEAVRRLLFYSRPEAARYIAAGNERPNGVSERAWRMFESGELPVPLDVRKKTRALIIWRAETIARFCVAPAGGLPPFPQTEDEFTKSTGQEPMYFRPFQSALAATYARLFDDASPTHMRERRLLRGKQGDQSDVDNPVD